MTHDPQQRPDEAGYLAPWPAQRGTQGTSLARLERLSGRPIAFKPDISLALRATLRIAPRGGAPTYVLRHRATNDSLDYSKSYRAGVALRLFGPA